MESHPDFLLFCSFSQFFPHNSPYTSHMKVQWPRKSRFSQGHSVDAGPEISANSRTELISHHGKEFGLRDLCPLHCSCFILLSLPCNEKLSAPYFNACQLPPLHQISSNEQHPGSTCPLCVPPQGPSTLCLTSTSY